MSEEDLNTYKKYVSDLDITKYIVLDSESNYWYSAEYVDKMLKKQDKEIERLNNIINKIEEHFVFLKMNSTGGNKEFFEDILDFIKALKELKGSDKE